MTGSIVFKNTHGYLSAQQYHNIDLNGYFLATFAILSAIWTALLYAYRSKILPVHHMVTVVLYACFFESMFTLLFYTNENKSLGDYALFWVFISFMEVVRSVFSRVIVLLTALG